MPLRRKRSTTFGPFRSLGSSQSVAQDERWYEDHAWTPSRYPGLTLEDDLAPAAWLGPRLDGPSFKVGMTVPRGYEAYARMFFPFVQTGIDSGDYRETFTRWSDRAAKNGKTVHALMEAETISLPPADDQHGYGQLSPEQLEALTPILRQSTSSTQGWFLLWEGYGDLNDQVFNPRVPRVRHEMRNFYLLRGPLDSYGCFSDNPSYWWPEDRTWCLCTDTDFSWSYLAASRSCVEAVLRSSVMDAVETALDNPARSGMDVINDPDGLVPRFP
jgi:hypothetical protein